MGVAGTISDMKSQMRNIIIGVLLLILGGVAGYRIRGTQGLQGSNPQTIFNLTNTTPPTEYKNVDFQQFWDVWKILQNDYLDPTKVQADQMVYGAIKGMTASLGDPYTIYLPPTDQKRSQEDLQGSFFGVGIQLGYINNTLAVMAPLKGSPAEKAGVKAKDLILHVKDPAKNLDKDTTGWSLIDAVDNIRGDKGTPVTLTLFRPDSDIKKPFDVTLVRDEILVPSVVVEYIQVNGKKLAHLTLSRFGERTQDELNKAITDITQQSPKVDGIMLDMRDNPGGFLDEAINVASEFVKSGVVVTQKGKYTSQSYQAKGNARLADYPLVVVVNGGSASASEIVAGALRDDLGAELVGEKTFGKGTVQDARTLDNGAGLHVTIARWLLPKGDWIHEQGIPVNVEIKPDPNASDDAILKTAEQELVKKLK